MLENDKASDATIRDADLAFEVSAFSKNQILKQTELSIVRPGEYLSRTDIVVVVSRIGVDGVVQGRIVIILRVPLEPQGRGFFCA